MKALIFGAILALTASMSSAASADCRLRCKEKALACKDRCKLNLPHLNDARHRCLKVCELNEHECKAKCG